MGWVLRWMREVRLPRELFVLSLVLKQPSPVSLVFGQRSPVQPLVLNKRCTSPGRRLLEITLCSSE